MNIFLKILNEPIFYVISLIFSTRIFKGVFETYYIYHIFCFLIRIFKKIFKILFLLIFSHQVLGENKFKHDQQIIIIQTYYGFSFRGFSHISLQSMIFHIIFSLYFSHWVLKEFLMEYQHIYVISNFLLFSQKSLRSFSHDIYIHTYIS